MAVILPTMLKIRIFCVLQCLNLSYFTLANTNGVAPCTKIDIDPETVRYRKFKLQNNGQNKSKYVKQIEIGDFTKGTNSESIPNCQSTDYSTYLVFIFKENNMVLTRDYQTLIESNIVHILNNNKMVIIRDKKYWVVLVSSGRTFILTLEILINDGPYHTV